MNYYKKVCSVSVIIIYFFIETCKGGAKKETQALLPLLNISEQMEFFLFKLKKGPNTRVPHHILININTL